MFKDMNLDLSLRLAMASKKVSGVKLAKVVGVTVQQISAWRSGDVAVPVKKLPVICKFLEMPVSEFVALGEV